GSARDKHGPDRHAGRQENGRGIARRHSEKQLQPASYQVAQREYAVDQEALSRRIVRSAHAAHAPHTTAWAKADPTNDSDIANALSAHTPKPVGCPRMGSPLSAEQRSERGMVAERSENRRRLSALC